MCYYLQPSQRTGMENLTITPDRDCYCVVVAAGTCALLGSRVTEQRYRVWSRWWSNLLEEGGVEQ
jgi:hypothetical protein